MRRILDWTIPYLKEHGSETPRLDAEVLLAHARNCPRIRLYTDFDSPLTPRERGLMRDLVRRRANAEPVAYLVGHREFFSLDFLVGPGVFIPRPDTELLVMAALDAAKEFETPEILELCAGSGCVSIAMARNNPQARVTAVEREPVPFDYATRNIAKHGLGTRLTLLRGDLFDPVPADQRFHLIVSNPPYIPSDEIPTLQPDVRDHEPHTALDGGTDGLAVIRRLIDSAPGRLLPGGWLMFELDPHSAEPAAALMTQRGFEMINKRLDLSGQARIVVGRWNPPH